MRQHRCGRATAPIDGGSHAISCDHLTHDQIRRQDDQCQLSHIDVLDALERVRYYLRLCLCSAEIRGYLQLDASLKSHNFDTGEAPGNQDNQHTNRVFKDVSNSHACQADQT